MKFKVVSIGLLVLLLLVLVQPAAAKCVRRGYVDHDVRYARSGAKGAGWVHMRGTGWLYIAEGPTFSARGCRCKATYLGTAWIRLLPGPITVSAYELTCQRVYLPLIIKD